MSDRKGGERMGGTAVDLIVWTEVWDVNGR